MSDPLGYNPIADSAPGPPTHDGALRGHAPGQYAPSGDGGQNYQSGYNNASSGLPQTYAESVMAKWGMRVFIAGIIWFTVPIQMALYPFAGAAGLVTGTVMYFLLGSGMDRETHLSWAWFGAYLGMLPAIRFENDFTDRNPKYRSGRHIARLVLFAGVSYWFDTRYQGDPPMNAIIVTLVATVILHFILRWGLTMGLWRALSKNAWLRSTD